MALVRSVVVACVACVLWSGCRTGAISLLPPISTQNPRDPNPMRPLVETPANQPPQEGYNASAAAGMVGPVSTTTSAAAAAVWLFSGNRPLLGLFGTFDENALFDDAAARKPKAPAAEQ